MVSSGRRIGGVMGDPGRGGVAFTVLAARLLLTAVEEGQNVERLARRLGCSPEIVARCARRLVDSGVWKNGRTVAAWIGEGIDHPTFWNDVAVAQGLLRRHIGEDGMLHWTPVGRWTPPQDREPGSPGGEPVGAGLRHGGWERPEFYPRVSAPPEQRRGDPIRRLFPDAQWME